MTLCFFGVETTTGGGGGGGDRRLKIHILLDTPTLAAPPPQKISRRSLSKINFSSLKFRDNLKKLTPQRVKGLATNLKSALTKSVIEPS